MARERMVTRTVTQLNNEVMCVNLETAQVEIKDITTPYFPDEKQTLKHIQKHYDCETVKHVSITSSTLSEVLYGMTEVDFIKLAKVLPPRNQSEVQ